MLIEIAVGLGLLVGGFALGRIKNAKKLAAIKADVEKLESSLSTEAKKLATAIKAKL